MLASLIISIESDAFFISAERERLANEIRNSDFMTNDSPEDHDAFRLSTEQVNTRLRDYIDGILPDILWLVVSYLHEPDDMDG